MRATYYGHFAKLQISDDPKGNLICRVAEHDNGRFTSVLLDRDQVADLAKKLADLAGGYAVTVAPMK